MTLVLDRRRVGDGHGTGDGMVVVVVVWMLVLESSLLGSCHCCRAGTWVVVGSCGCSRWSGCRTLGSSFFVFPRSLDIYFVYLTMYLIDAIFRGGSYQFQKRLSAPDGSLLGPINVAGKVH